MRRLLLGLLLAGLFSGAVLAHDNSVTVKLETQNNSGQNGTATLLPDGNKTQVVIELSNVQTGVVQPAHIHMGSCKKLDKAPKWPLEPVKNGRSVTLLPVSLATILKQRTAINVHKSEIEPQIYVSCGNILAAI